MAILPLLGGCGDPPYYVAVAMDGPGVDAVRLGLQMVMAEGGVEGRAVRVRPFRMEPTTSEAALLDTLRTWAADSSVQAVIVAPGRASTLHATQILGRGGVPHFVAAPAPLLPDSNPYRFYLHPTAGAEARFLAERVIARGNDPRVGLFFVDADYGKAARDVLVARLAEAGIQPVGEAVFPQETDEAQLLSLTGELAESRPDAIVWIGPMEEFSVALPGIRSALPSDGRVYMTGRAETRHLYHNPESYFTDVRFVRPIDNITAPDSAMKDFIFSSISWSGGVSRSQDLLLYEAARLVGQAIREVGAGRDSIRDYIASLGRERPPFPSLGKPLQFTGPGRSMEWPLDLAVVSSRGVMSALADEAVEAQADSFAIRIGQ